jgi:hypothetical protein
MNNYDKNNTGNYKKYNYEKRFKTRAYEKLKLKQKNKTP